MSFEKKLMELDKQIKADSEGQYYKFNLYIYGIDLLLVVGV